MTDSQDPTFSRRGFAQAVVAGSLMVGFSRVGAGAPFANLPQLDGELSFDPAVRAEYASAATSFVSQALPHLTPADLGGIQGIRMFLRSS